MSMIQSKPSVMVSCLRHKYVVKLLGPAITLKTEEYQTLSIHHLLFYGHFLAYLENRKLWIWTKLT